MALLLPSKARPSIDPISRLQEPPVNETATERVARLEKEEDARRHSDLIDKAIEKERKDYLTKLKNRREDLVLLILGPSGSGKSTFLRQVRLMYDADGLAQERDAFRLTIFLSLIQITRCLLDLLGNAMPSSNSISPPMSPSFRPRTAPSNSRPDEGNALRRLRLAPLLSVEESLRKRIGIVAPQTDSFRHLADAPSSHRRRSFMANTPLDSLELDESAVDVGEQPYSVFPRHWQNNLAPTAQAQPPVRSTFSPNWQAPPGDPSYLMEGCRDEIAALWAECVNQGLIAETGPRAAKPGGSRLSESARYFLDNLDRVASKTYRPTDDDLMFTRIRTVGIEEHAMTIDNRLYRIVDVAGARGIRPIWASYFEHARSVIYMTSLGDFDVPSPHDPKSTAFEDAFEGFRQLCSNRLLIAVDLIVFLNKIDLLCRKLRSGRVDLSVYFPNFRSSSAEAERYKELCDHAASKFRAIVLRGKPDRILYTHYTTATSITNSRNLFRSVKDNIIRKRLETAGLM